MIDLVKRLRHAAMVTQRVESEAAEEIERLQAEVARQQTEIESLHKRFEAAITLNEPEYKELRRQIILLREVLEDIAGWDIPMASSHARDALAATDDLSNCILCDAEPVAWMMDTEHKTSGEKSTWISTDPKGWTQMVSVTYGEQHPLYRAWEPK